MKDKDKEAFNEWRNSTSTRLDIHDAWQAACEYKDKEQYIEGSIHESGGIKREMTWKESSEMMERMYQGAIAQLNREYERIKKFKDEIQEWKEAARSEADEVNRLQTENKKLREALEVVLGYDGDFLSTSAEVRLNVAKYAAEQALKEIKE